MGMNKRGRGGQGRHWKFGDRPAVQVTAYIDPKLLGIVRKDAKKHRTSASHEICERMARSLHAGHVDEQIHAARIENRELKRLARNVKSQQEDTALLNEALLGLLRQQGVRLDRDSLRKLLVAKKREQEAAERRSDPQSPSPLSAVHETPETLADTT